MATYPSTAPPAPDTRTPWYVWCSVLAITSAIIGGQWDISWHSSIGRDTFWTPAHMAIYFCGVLAGVVCGYLILRDTFTRGGHTAVVHVLGFRGPLGAFIAAWGGIVMLTSAPFDNWWHDAYGLDVKIVSPPHVALITGIFAVGMGALILTLGYMNRATGTQWKQLQWLFLYTGGMLIALLQVLLLEFNDRIHLHSSLPYRMMAILLPFVLAGVWRAANQKFAATIVTGVYTLLNIGLILILPLFPAVPKLGPVYQAVTHFVPQQFPILLIVPAFCLDLLWQRTANLSKSIVAVVSGAIFVLALLAVEWPFADFLMSPASRNAFFGTGYFGYFLPAQSHLARGLFVTLESTPEFWANIGLAMIFAMASMRLGMAWGDWMRRVRR
jgi:hypothetical protein